MDSYRELNKAFYAPRYVRYSWRGVDLKKIQKMLERNNFRVEIKTRKRWDNVWFVRDGSFIVLEDTLSLIKNNRHVADFTKRKALIRKRFFESEDAEWIKKIVDENYKRKFSIGCFFYIIFMLSLLAFVLRGAFL